MEIRIPNSIQTIHVPDPIRAICEKLSCTNTDREAYMMHRLTDTLKCIVDKSIFSGMDWDGDCKIGFKNPPNTSEEIHVYEACGSPISKYLETWIEGISDPIFTSSPVLIDKWDNESETDNARDAAKTLKGAMRDARRYCGNSDRG